MGRGGNEPSGIDQTMDRASEALVETRYFDACRLCWEAMLEARAAQDFERMSRICLPLQEARRQIRQLATDTGRVHVVARSEDVPHPIEPGCYLIQPPMIGLEARRLRDYADGNSVAVFCLAREPMTRDGRWPVVGVGNEVVRTYVAPPEGVEAREGVMTRDSLEPGPSAISIDWFESAGEALGDEGVRAAMDVSAGEPPAWHVEDLLDRLAGVPEHEKLHQALAQACRDAAQAPPPQRVRRRQQAPNPFSF